MAPSLRKASWWFAAAPLALASCSVFGIGPESSGGQVTTRIDCAYNHAYQENYSADSIEAILADAAGCYVLIDTDMLEDPAPTVSSIKAADNQVGCYISVGTGEDWRGDFNAMRPGLSTEEWDQWPGEYFVTDTEFVLPTMLARIDLLAEQGCEWVEFDNMDWDYDPAGAASYTGAICRRVHDRGMRCMAKSTTLGSALFDGLTVESEAENRDWWPHSEAESIIKLGGPFLIVHYDETDCDGMYEYYSGIYADSILFLCEDPTVGGYQHPGPG